MSRIWCNSRQLSTFTANISGTHRNVDKWKTELSTMIFPALNKKSLVNFGPPAKKVIGTHVDPP